MSFHSLPFTRGFVLEILHLFFIYRSVDRKRKQKHKHVHSCNAMQCGWWWRMEGGRGEWPRGGMGFGWEIPLATSAKEAPAQVQGRPKTALPAVLQRRVRPPTAECRAFGRSRTVRGDSKTVHERWWRWRFLGAATTTTTAFVVRKKNAFGEIFHRAPKAPACLASWYYSSGSGFACCQKKTTVVSYV